MVLEKKEKITPINVRDSIIECFLGAHKEILEQMKEFGSFSDDAEFSKMKRMNVEALLRKFFDDVGGDFDAPTKEKLILVLEKLKNYASNFRNNEVVTKHFHEMSSLIQKIG